MTSTYNVNKREANGRSPGMNNEFPHFEMDEVALLISAVQKALERLQRANESRGGNDPEFLEYGRRYSIILQKLESVASGRRTPET